MKETSFLRKLKKEGKIGLVEPSEEMRASYSIKAENCLKSAKILFQNQLYENSTSEAYYCIYNSLLSLLFKIGIKSENHSASIVLFKEIFDKPELTKIISWAKNERIDKQYYVESHQVIKATKDSCSEMIKNAENFLVKIKLLIGEINIEQISSIRLNFDKTFE